MDRHQGFAGQADKASPGDEGVWVEGRPTRAKSAIRCRDFADRDCYGNIHALETARIEGRRQALGAMPESAEADMQAAVLARHLHPQTYEEGEPESPASDPRIQALEGLGRGKYTGLAISGGGIRSATFALGVLQSLARADLLKRFDYLSTVSGGGYIGSSVIWYLNGKRGEGDRADQGADGTAFNPGPGTGGPGIGDPETESGNGNDAAHFPYGTAGARDRAHAGHWTGPLRFLRDHADYLKPDDRIDLLSGLAVALRGILLNLLVWLPLVTGMFLVMFQETGRLPEALESRLEAVRNALFTIIWPGTGGSGNIKNTFITEYSNIFFNSYINLFEVLVLAGASVLLLFLAISVLYSLGTYLLPVLAGLFGAGDSSYDWRRRFETHVKYLLPLGLGALVAGGLPYFLVILGEGGGDAGKMAGMLFLTGLLFMLPGTMNRGAMNRSSRNSPLRRLVLPLSATLILGGGLVFTCWLALSIHTGGEWARNLFLAALLLAVLTGLVVNSNHIALHRFYRDRLMETFMPGAEAVERNVMMKAKAADRAGIAALGGGLAPCHLVNTNLVLVNARDTGYRRRGGDNFVISPLYCGGDAGGYVDTRAFADGRMTLATAMAISGAAAHPNAGWAGTGPAHSRSISALMSLLNIRLGYHVRNPAGRGGRGQNAGGSGVLRKFLDRPNHFNIPASALLSGRFRETSPWYELSDGGHFENLGIYELIRRRTGLILALDAGADPGFSFGDLRNTVRKASEDFGVTVTFGRRFWNMNVKPRPGDPAGKTGYEGRKRHELNRLSSLVPYRDAGFPAGGELTDHGYVIATVEYPGVPGTGAVRETGILIYVKATMIAGPGLETRGYKAAHPEFPHQSTTDQFFDPAQFEAYRELGNTIGEDMIAGARLRALLALAWGKVAPAPPSSPAPSSGGAGAGGAGRQEKL